VIGDVRGWTASDVLKQHVFPSLGTVILIVGE
jgi:hypothetical protein